MRARAEKIGRELGRKEGEEIGLEKGEKQRSLEIAAEMKRKGIPIGRGAFPNDDSIKKLLYLGLQNVAKKWTQPVANWNGALNQFAILFGERVTP